jgi:hypothetical protein
MDGVCEEVGVGEGRGKKVIIISKEKLFMFAYYAAHYKCRIINILSCPVLCCAVQHCKCACSVGAS